MTTHMTKTWFDGKNIITQEIPEAEIYKREWVGLTDDEILEAWHWGGCNPHIEGAHFKALYHYFEDKLKAKNT